MKKITVLFIAIISLFSVFQINALTAYADFHKDPYYDVKDPSVNDVWNYLINNIGGGLEEMDKEQQELKDRLDEVESKVDTKNVKKETTEALDDYYGEIKASDEIDKSTVFPRSILTVANDMWGLVGNELKSYNGGKDTFGNKYNLIITADNYTDIQNVMKVFGYSLCLIFFSAGLIESTIKYEIFTLKGGAQVFGRLIISKIIIDASVKVCMAIINGVGDITSKIINIGEKDNIFQFPDPKILVGKSDVKIIGPILDTITGFILSIPLAIVFICVLLCAIFVLVKLILRSFELALLVSVSPAFFACASSDVSKPYFKNFILTLTQCASQIIFMAVVLKVGTKTLTLTPPAINSLVDAGAWFAYLTPYILIVISMSIMMVKPPKVLTGLVK